MAYLDSEAIEDRILFVGLSQSGKTSIIQVAFEGMNPESTMDNQATGRFRKKKVELSGQIVSVIEVGGQIPFIEESLKTYKKSVFSHLRTLFFVVDVADPDLFEKANYYLKQVCQNALDFNEDVQIIVFAHKVDLVSKEEASRLIEKFSELFELDKISRAKVYTTTIFDEGLIDIIQEIWNEQ
ncbi:MAG: 50S ribosome-binding GTPase [Candidatus Heimdallarchaeota archaeon]|nr:50S ribosome-binding GTPase [Candidatus Heimdallarchaeota archaeon]MCK4876952.1 50S ribosome-binding GTPase [Candidatus Heimdallarchaeota archaeon]